MWQGVSLRKREEMLRGSGNYNNSNEEKEMEILGKDEEDEEESEMSNCSAPQQQQQQHEHNYNTSCFNIINNIQPHQVLMVSTDVSTTALSSQHQYSLQQKVLLFSLSLYFKVCTFYTLWLNFF